ncbi:ankyrin repeat-containing domain protein, partial [Baffinella frigidus]
TATRRLIERGVDINALSGPLRRTALETALSMRDIPLVNVLIANGACVNQHNQYGTTPLIGAVIQGFVAGVELLIAHGADVMAADHGGSTPLHTAAEVCARNKNTMEIVPMLLHNGADVNARTATGVTVLMHTAKVNQFSGLRELYQLLMKGGHHTKPRIDDTDNGGQTAMHYAVRYRNLEAIQLLLLDGASIDIRDHS